MYRSGPSRGPGCITKAYDLRVPLPEAARIDALQSLMIWSHRVGRVIAREAGSTTPVAQWRALATLSEEGPMRIGSLAAECRVTQPGMTRLVASMVEFGLVARVVDGDDPRAVLVSLTEAGRAALADWHRTIRDMLAPRFADLAAEDWAAIERAAAIVAERTPSVLVGAAR